MGPREVQEGFINQGTESKVSSLAQWLGLHQQQAVLLAGKMLLLLKELNYVTEIHKQSWHEMKSVSYKTAGCGRKNLVLETQGLSDYYLWNPG